MQHYPDRSTMGAPGACILCEGTPPEGTGYVDTLRNFNPGFPSSLAGAKYVCDSCVKNLAEAAGFYASESVLDSDTRARVAETRLHAVVNHVQSVLGNLSDEVLHAKGREASAAIEPVEPPKPKKKTVDVPVVE